MRVYLPPSYVTLGPGSLWVELAPGVWGKRMPELVTPAPSRWIADALRDVAQLAMRTAIQIEGQPEK